GPGGRLSLDAARGEAVREDLVDDRALVPRRRARVECEPEVVAARDLAANDSEPVQPGVSTRAAGEEPAIADDRVLDRQLCAPPTLALADLVDDGGHGLRLAVADEAEQHLIRCAVGDADSDGRSAAELVGPLRDVQIRAVVM